MYNKNKIGIQIYPHDIYNINNVGFEVNSISLQNSIQYYKYKLYYFTHYTRFINNNIYGIYLITKSKSYNGK